MILDYWRDNLESTKAITTRSEKWRKFDEIVNIMQCPILKSVENGKSKVRHEAYPEKKLFEENIVMK